ncbi:MAG: winged helix-turn-helix domain-containing protein [Terriglobia bacterium]
MGNPAGVKRDFKALARRRLQAARLLSKGCSPSQVASQLGVARQSVNRWRRQEAKLGRSGLKRAGQAGRKPQLGAGDLRRIEAALKRGPEAQGYATRLWTLRRVVKLIEQECGVRYTTVQAWRILRQLRWSCQRPVGRALERDEAAIQRWKRERGPELKKSPKTGPNHHLCR